MECHGDGGNQLDFESEKEGVQGGEFLTNEMSSLTVKDGMRLWRKPPQAQFLIKSEVKGSLF